MIPGAADEIACHPRSYEREVFVLVHCTTLTLLGRKIGALDQAAQRAGWELPAQFVTLRAYAASESIGRPTGC
jgi:hypothetical protein